MTSSGFYQTAMVCFCVVGTMVLIGWWYLQLNILQEIGRKKLAGVHTECCVGWICGMDYWIMSVILFVFGNFPPAAGAIMATFSLACRSGMLEEQATSWLAAWLLDAFFTVSLVSTGVFVLLLLAFFGFLAYKRCADEKDPEDLGESNDAFCI